MGPLIATRAKSIAALLAAAMLASACTLNTGPAAGDAAIVALTATELEQELAAGRLNAEQVTEAYLRRIDSLDDQGPAVHAIIELNPDALSIARSLDAAFAVRGPVGALHGIPIVLKANIDTRDRMATTAGSAALEGHRASDDAALVARLRAAGAVIIAKANLSEWANFRSNRSVSGWSGLGGQTHNPYVLDRNPCGSSSGSAVAVSARLAPLAVGTETDGSIICPSAVNGIVGLKPTVGLVAQDGIIPISRTQDTAGPMARTVADAALLLETLAEPRTQPATRTAMGLIGARLGVVRDYVGAGGAPDVEDAYANALGILEAQGAVLVDPIELAIPREARAAEFEVMLYEFKDGIERYLRDADAGPSTLADLIQFNELHASTEMPLFGQDVFLAAAQKGSLNEAAYAQAVSKSHDFIRERLAEVFAQYDLDALVAPSNGPAWPTDPALGNGLRIGSAMPAAASGYPSITIPSRLVGELPVGISLIARPFDEARMLGLAAAFEQARGAFPEPKYLPSLGAE